MRVIRLQQARHNNFILGAGSVDIGLFTFDVSAFNESFD
jgi:hypothetical protein